ncbi:MAG TPA: hypothetical protein VGB43_04385 [Flavobacterium sp.]|jgi:hypothetical protein
MRKIFTLTLIILFSVSCSKDDDFDPVADKGLSVAPDAKIDFNDNNFGIYKGILVGISGVIKVNINNDDNLNATLTINGENFQFETIETVAVNESIVGLTFTNGNSSFDFNVDGTGENPFITNLELEHLPFANIEILKEYSDAHVRCYEGTYSNSAGTIGVFNIATIGNSLYGLAKSNDEADSYFLEGVMIGDINFTGSFLDGNFDGLISGIAMGGDWANSSGTGTWQGQRKL